MFSFSQKTKTQEDKSTPPKELDRPCGLLDFPPHHFFDRAMSSPALESPAFELKALESPALESPVALPRRWRLSSANAANALRLRRSHAHLEDFATNNWCARRFPHKPHSTSRNPQPPLRRWWWVSPLLEFPNIALARLLIVTPTNHSSLASNDSSQNTTETYYFVMSWANPLLMSRLISG